MAVQILSQSYGPRKPLIECTADSLDDLVGLVCAEGSTATVGGTEYVLDRVNGWVEPGSGGGGGGSGALVVNAAIDQETGSYTLDKTWQELNDATLAIVKYIVVEDGVNETAIVGVVAEDSGLYNVTLFSAGSILPTSYSCESATDYPIGNTL